MSCSPRFSPLHPPQRDGARLDGAEDHGFDHEPDEDDGEQAGERPRGLELGARLEDCGMILPTRSSFRRRPLQDELQRAAIRSSLQIAATYQRFGEYTRPTNAVPDVWMCLRPATRHKKITVITTAQASKSRFWHRLGAPPHI